MRKNISKKKRLQVYEKCKGHCAYCGCELDIKDMQVDHIEPIYKYETAYGAGAAGFLDDIENLLPACRQCNFYKSTFSIEDFRKRIQRIKDNLQKTFIYKLALKYGIVTENDKPIVFYYEKMKEGD